MSHRRSIAAAVAVTAIGLTTLWACSTGTAHPPLATSTMTMSMRPTSAATATATTTTVAPPSGALDDVYAHAGAGMLAPAAARARSLVYVPNSTSNTVDVIDPRTYKIVEHFAVGALPQHVVPSWDLRTLYVANDMGNSLTPIDPLTGKPGKRIPVLDPYNMYFTPDGKHALVMAERYRQIDVRDPHTMKLQHVLHVPCSGVNHADFTADGSTMLVSCEFSGKLLVIPTSMDRVTEVIDLNKISTPGAPDMSAANTMSGGSMDPGATSMPQDVRLTPDGRHFLVADMTRGGVWVVDAATMKVTGFIRTGAGAHGIYPSRDAKDMYVSDRGAGAITVLDASTLKIRATWRIPGGGSPDMGGVTEDGSQLWLSGRYNGVVYVISTRTGKLLHEIRVGGGPHGLAVWPQPGRYSLGHTGNMR